jgi:predicted CopG family antitoxin
MQKRISVGLKYEVYNKLKAKGKFGETFSDLIERIVDESGEPLESQY